MFSACATGFWGKGVILTRPEVLATFPNLKTVWAYASLSPTSKVAQYAVRTWATTSEGREPEQAIAAAAAEQRKRGFGVPVIWRRAGAGLEPMEPRPTPLYE